MNPTMPPTRYHTNKPLLRLPKTLALVGGWMLGLALASAQTKIASNAKYQADFQGKDGAHEWTLDLAGDFNSLRLQVESPTAELGVFLIPPGKERAIKLVAVPRKGRGYSSVGVRGTLIEATQDPRIKLAPGRYIIQIKPYDSVPAGKYSIKIVEPTLDKEAPPAGVVPESKESNPSPVPLPPPAPEKADLKALIERLEAVEKRLDLLEKAR